MPVDESLFDRDAAVLRDKYGKDVLHTGSEMLAIERIPVDSPSIMRITSGPDPDGNIIGGVPVGRITRIYGASSTGKTLLCWNIIKNAQQYRSKRFPTGMSCVYWNVEKQFDKLFVARHGVDVDNLKVMESDVIEDIAAQMELLLGSRHLFVIDSASFATALEELVGKKDSKNPEYQVQVGSHARAWKRAINRIHHAMDQEQNTVIVVDHVGMKNVGNGNYQVEEPLSGKRMQYRSDLSLHFRSGSWLFYNKEKLLDKKDKIKEETGVSPEGMKSPDGTEVSVICAKSRVCRPLRTSLMRFDLRLSDFDTTFEFTEFGRYYDEDGMLAHQSGKQPIISKSGSFYRVPGYDKAIQGESKLRATIAADPMVQKLILSSMMKAE